jgi:hypothetical protein
MTYLSKTMKGHDNSQSHLHLENDEIETKNVEIPAKERPLARGMEKPRYRCINASQDDASREKFDAIMAAEVI